jgi:hypothetical protein
VDETKMHQFAQFLKLPGSGPVNSWTCAIEACGRPLRWDRCIACHNQQLSWHLQQVQI